MLVASASFTAGLIRPAVPRRRATRITACEPSLGRAGRHLEACGDALVRGSPPCSVRTNFRRRSRAHGPLRAVRWRFRVATSPRRPRRAPTRIGRRRRVRLPALLRSFASPRPLPRATLMPPPRSRRPLPPSRTPRVAQGAFLSRPQPDRASRRAALRCRRRRNSSESTATGSQTSTERARAASPARASSEERASSLLPGNSLCSRDRGSRAAKSACASKILGNSFTTLGGHVGVVELVVIVVCGRRAARRCPPCSAPCPRRTS